MTAGDERATSIPILVYHGVADDADGPLSPWVVTPDEFGRHLDAVLAAGCRVMTLGALVKRVHGLGLAPEPGSIALTFDDGFADFATGAWPALVRRGLPSTLYVTTGGIGGGARWLPGSAAGRQMLAWTELRDLAAEGVEIGAHTHSHPELDVLPLDRARDEIRRGRALLEDGLSRPVETFAYPHGYHSRRLRRLVAEEGFSSACAVGHALSSPADDRFALARVMVRHGDDSGAVRRWANGEGLPIRPGGRGRSRAVAWRQLRRMRHGSDRTEAVPIR